MYKINLSLKNGLSLKADVHGFRPERPAPACSNPDNPRFSDPGDDAEFDGLDIYFEVESFHWNPKTQRNEERVERIDLNDEQVIAIQEALWDQIIEKSTDAMYEYLHDDEEPCFTPKKRGRS